MLLNLSTYIIQNSYSICCVRTRKGYFRWKKIVLGMFGVVRGDSGWFRFFDNIPLKFNYKNRIFINCYCWRAKIVTINYSPKTFFNWLPRSNLRDPPINEKSIAEKSINFTKIEIKKVSRGFQWKSFYCSSLTPTPNY